MGSQADWTFSAETAIVVCRQAGYFPQALALAKKHREHEWVVRVSVFILLRVWHHVCMLTHTTHTHTHTPHHTHFRRL